MLDPAIFSSFKTITLEEMGKVRLMNRVDTKFVTTLATVQRILERATAGYLLQQIDGESNMPYFTRYFDTPDMAMYHEHQRGKACRQKLRIRAYEGPATLSFLEIKDKNNRGRTRKTRVKLENGNQFDDHTDFISEHLPYSPEGLQPVIENHFYRVTLVNEERTERITIDTALEFHNLMNGESVSFPNLGIIEWKRAGNGARSAFGSLLREFRVKQSGFSKYCIGLAITDETLRQNRLKQKLRRIAKINAASGEEK
ncbi:MAG: polyphosphate polymerase domain-containing protein [Muribaculaceae bacterium]|nr:polyphosphate polymerase domain-containing protein [Muribaculaceae bacterium]